ncbi:BTAD domain-containing putative transcriptional regulator [Streptomyces sp. NPDC059740]|uniref:AfsR/SARP family transcriptional regulator n=1 Tax=Streptomyces sp. NPDC059740 TaxID=3346926 RepID=UPI0036463C13
MTEDPGREPLRFAVLGPVRAWRAEAPLATGSPQQRALLAALLLRGPRTATVSELVDALWGEEPPPAAVAALRTYASRLRKTFGADAAILVSESGGYALRPAPDRPLVLDADLAEQYALEAEKARALGDRAGARSRLADALGLWDGEVLAGVPGPFAETQRARLAERRLTLLEARLALDLDLGDHAEAVAELTALTAAHPLRERLRELLMLALYRGGRQAEALAVYTDTRRLLADELGVDPCATLTDLHQRMLRADPALAGAPAPVGEATLPALPAPRQLPAAVADFTGRTGFVSELGEQLASAEGRVMAVSAVAGIGGVGKTTLAVHVAHAAAERFPDGQLYADLQGAGPTPAAPGTVLGAFLRALGVPQSAVPENLEERAALYRSTLAGRRVLTLLDDARDAAQVRPLLPGTEGCAALVTSRARMADLEGAHLVDLDVMTTDEALTLFTRIVGADRAGVEREAALDVVAACGFLPLAIRIAASRLAARRNWTVSLLAGKLADERRRLDELRVGDLAVKATFELGYSQLEPVQARAFRLLGLAEGPDVSLAAAAALLDLDQDTAEELVESLVDVSLLEVSSPGRYRFHDLVRLFARACAERDEQPSEQEAALRRLLDFYLATAVRVHALEESDDWLAGHLLTSTTPGLDFPDGDAALRWMYSEGRCLLSCAMQSTGRTSVRRAVDLLLAADYLAEAGEDALQYKSAAKTLLTAAQRHEDVVAQARAHIVLSTTHTVAGRLDIADTHATSAMLLGAAAQDGFATSQAANERGVNAIASGRYEDAQAYLEQALDAFREMGNVQSVAAALSNLARAHLGAGRVGQAVELAQESVDIYRSTEASVRLANGLYSLGIALNQADQREAAVARLEEGLKIFLACGQPFWAAMTRMRLAEVLLQAGSSAEAAVRAEQALATLGPSGAPRWRADILTLHGRTLHELGQRERAMVRWRDALALYEEMGSPRSAEVAGLLSRAPSPSM